MKIRGKIVLIVLPLIVTPLLFSGLIATLLARNGITSVATQFLRFKAEQIGTYANGQWQLLLENGLQDQEYFRSAAVEAIDSFAESVIRTDSELIFAVDGGGGLGFSSGAESTEELERRLLASEDIELANSVGWNRLSLAGVDRVAYAVSFEPLDWTIYVSERATQFYESTTAIIRQLSVVLGVSVLLSLVLLLLFSDYLTKPLRRIVEAMKGIIETNDLSERVQVLYSDETGELAQTFNIMTRQLEQAYESIKSQAYRAASSEVKERKTRTMFQKYVPNGVIEQFFANPERMLVGDERVVSILFSDIRDFTTISESMAPDELVESLNRYFTLMVDTIMSHHGIVDKYIGDAVMALFGTPEKRDDDARQSVHAALEMIDSLKDFNVWQTRRGQKPFRIGIGLNYGMVTVGNIGSEKKLDYTVIGDMVNVASRLEGLTKRYRVPIIISESVKRKVEDEIAAGAILSRVMDTVQVKGKTDRLRVFAVARGLSDAEAEGWKLHNEAMELFYQRDFERARRLFSSVGRLIPDDASARSKEQYCGELMEQSPPPGWTGVVGMREK